MSGATTAGGAAAPSGDGRTRCAWARGFCAAYHDAEWGVPVRDDRGLFELLTLEGAQAGLSWETVLRRRDGYRAAFAGFDVEAVAAFGSADVARLLGDARVVRHAAKIRATVANAAALLRVRAERGSFAAWLWAFTGGEPIVVGRGPGEPAAAATPLSREVSAALRARGFAFVGPTIVYALLQAAGLVDDHDAGCFRASEPPADAARRGHADA